MRFLGVALAIAAFSGCDCAGSDRPSPGPGPEAADPTTSTTGTLVGIVRLAEGAEVPAYPENPVQIEGRPAIPASCTAPREDDRRPVRPSEASGGLMGLSIVATSSSEEGWPGPGDPVTHEVEIRDCRLSPSILVATRGDRLRLTNATDYPFFPDLGEGMLQYRTEPREIALEQGGVRTIACAFAAPCGRLEVITLYHPVHTVTGDDGRFRLEGVPVDREIVVTAWHPLFEETHTTVSVAAGRTVEVELVIRPAPPPLPAPAAPPPTTGHPEDHPDPNIPF